ncbi:MAG: segregation/condensation protein A [Andreesenia angusta]|nr:segregation/condensation protein A [Andreesenia angusta]
MYNIDIEEFQGPLELLNHLIEKNKIDIYDIPISEITDQYIEYIEAMKVLNLEITSEFIVIASNLLYIKSKILLPKAVEEEDPREELVNKILEYRKYKLVSEQIRKRFEINSKIYYKLKEDMDYIEEDSELDFDLQGLLDAYRRVLDNISLKEKKEGKEREESLLENIRRDEFSVEEGIDFVIRKLRIYKNLEFSELFEKKTNKYRIVTIFMAILELIKERKIEVKQSTLFGEIRITALDIL